MIENAMEVKEKNMIGCELVLDPKMSGMFVDPLNKITLGFFKTGQDRVKITEGMNLSNIKRNIKAGILRVVKDTKDISTEFGGTEESTSDWKFQPIVDAPKKPNTDKDKPLLNFLARNLEDKIVQDINSLQDYDALHRLYELEKLGKNSVCQSRAKVIDALENALERVSGMTEAREIPDKKKDVISIK